MTSRKVYEVLYTTILRVFLTICLYIMLYLMVDFVIVPRILSKYVFHAWSLSFDILQCVLNVFKVL